MIIDDLAVGTTGADGRLQSTFPAPDSGLVTIHVDHPEYYPYHREIQLPALNTSGISLILEPIRQLHISCVERTSQGGFSLLPGVTIMIDGREAGVTGDDGVLLHMFKGETGDRLVVIAYKTGYGILTATPVIVDVPVGKRRIDRRLEFVPMAVIPPMSVTVTAIHTDTGAALPGLVISRDGVDIGVTADDGSLTIDLTGPPCSPVDLAFRAEALAVNPAGVRIYTQEGQSRHILVNAAVEMPLPPIAPPPVFTITTEVNYYASIPDSAIESQYRDMIETRLVQLLAKVPYLEVHQLPVREQVEDGWRQRRLPVDFVMQASVFAEDELRLLLLLYDAHGTPWYKRQITGITRSSIPHALAEAVNELRSRFPVQGTVTAIDGLRLTLDIGGAFDLRIGDVMVDDVRRTSATVDQVEQDRVVAILAEGTIGVGGRLIRLQPALEHLANTGLLLSVLDADTQEPIPRALVHVDGRSGGITDDDGYLGLTVPLHTAFSLEITKLGYRSFTKTFSQSGETKRQIHLSLNYCEVEINSIPNGSTVLLEDRRLGTTPLHVRLKVGFYKLRLRPRDTENFADFVYPDRVAFVRRKVILNLTHEGNYLQEAKRLQNMNDNLGAIEMYKLIPEPGDPSHAESFIEAQFAIGRINLDAFLNYKDAAEAFRNVLRWDDKYAVCHVNLGLALFKQKYYQAAAESFSTALTYRRHIPAGQADDVLGDALFYLAMANQQLSEESTGTEARMSLSDKACRHWKEYLDFYDRLDKAARLKFAKNHDMALSYKQFSCR
ncbi:PEGA domain-containing protein [bacterium]|nr:PEGA domain-containing protein [candidate division CSSED10-310 bacterium]